MRDPARLAVLRALELLDSPPEPAFDNLTRLVAAQLHVPVSLVSLVDEGRQFFKSQVGLPEPWASRRETPLTHSFCQHVVAGDCPLVVRDARRHRVLRANLAVTELRVVAYAGVPLRTVDGQVLGSLCAVDLKPRTWEPEDIALLERLGTLATTLVHLRDERRRAEAATRTMDESLARVSDGIVVLDRDWRYVFINPAGAALFGRKPEDLLGKHIWTEFPEGRGQPFHLAYERAMATQQPIVLEDYYAPWDRWFENRIHPSPDGVTIFYHETTDRKRTEEALRASAERLEFVAQGTGTGLWDWDLATNEVRYSREWKRMLGYQDHEVADHLDEWRRLTHPDDVEATLARVATYLARPEGALEAEFRMRHKNGEYRWILSRATAQVDGHGKAVRLLGLHIDVTERKQDQDQLRERERVLAALISNLPGAVFRVRNDPNYTAEYVSEQIAELTGYPAVDFRENRRSFGELTHPDDRDRVWNETQKALGEHRPYEVTYRLHDARGQVRWNWERGAGIFAANGEVQAVEGFVQDITERKRAEERLRESEERHRVFAALTSDYVYVFRVQEDGRRVLDWISDSFARVLGYTLEEYRALTTPAGAVIEEDVPAATANWARLLAGETTVVELRVRDRHGRIRWIRNYAQPVWDDRHSRIVQVYGAAQDISESKEAERRLRESYQQVRKLAAGLERAREAERARISRELHDELGQVLTGLKMDLAWLAGRLPAADAALRERTGAMGKLLDEAVGVGRRIAGELRPGVLDDLGLAAALRWQAREFGRRMNVSVSVDAPEQLALDPERATAAFRVVQEALTNVARHAGATAVTVRAAVTGGDLALEVRDNGRGIAADRTSGTESFGILGMRERVTAWGGDLTITPAPGGGTVLAARIPLDRDRAEQ